MRRMAVVGAFNCAEKIWNNKFLYFVFNFLKGDGVWEVKCCSCMCIRYKVSLYRIWGKKTLSTLCLTFLTY